MGSRRSTDKPSDRADADHSRWIRWRADRLLRAGFPDELAQRLARQDRVDVHALLELVDRGCPPHLAARILAPLDEDPAPSSSAEREQASLERG